MSPWTTQFCFGGGEIAQTVLPFGFQAARDEPILRLHRAVTALGSLGLILQALDLEPPLGKGGVAVGLELLDRKQYRVHGSRCDSVEKSVRHSLIDRQTADVEAVHAAALDDVFTGAVIARSRVSAAIVSAQSATAMATGGDALQ